VSEAPRESDLEQPLWTPDAGRVAASALTRFARLLHQRHGVPVDDYTALHHFSVTRMPEFWSAVWDHGGVIGERGHGPRSISIGCPARRSFRTLASALPGTSCVMPTTGSRSSA
jgi:hypothetical protein